MQKHGDKKGFLKKTCERKRIMQGNIINMIRKKAEIKHRSLI